MDQTNRINQAVERLPKALNAAGWSEKIDYKLFNVSYIPAPHTIPEDLPAGFAAIYGFHDEADWLKIGKVGPGSGPRFRYQHYKSGSAPSTLAGTLFKNDWFSEKYSDQQSEILARTGRMNILIHRSLGESFLGFLESFFILCFQPRFEGHKWK